MVYANVSRNEMVELLAEKAVRRIRRESVQCSAQHIARIHASAVRDAQDGLETAGHRSSHLAQLVHNRINAMMVEAGLATWQGVALCVAH